MGIFFFFLLFRLAYDGKFGREKSHESACRATSKRALWWGLCILRSYMKLVVRKYLHAKIEGIVGFLHSAGKAPFGNAADPARSLFLFRRGFRTICG